MLCKICQMRFEICIFYSDEICLLWLSTCQFCVRIVLLIKCIHTKYQIASSYNLILSHATCMIVSRIVEHITYSKFTNALLRNFKLSRSSSRCRVAHQAFVLDVKLALDALASTFCIFLNHARRFGANCVLRVPHLFAFLTHGAKFFQTCSSRWVQSARPRAGRAWGLHP